MVIFNNRPKLALISLTFLALITGCTPQAEPPQNSSSPPLPNSSAPQTPQPEPPKAPPKPLLVSPDNPDPTTNAKIQQYINNLAAQGFAATDQGVWMQSGTTLLANHQGTVPLSAASVTKIATTIAVLQTFGPEHQFSTVISATGPIENGQLNGDLVIQGGEDPFFVWEEAIALGNVLNQIGIKKITGNLIITGKFYMNYELDPEASGNLLKLGLNSNIWPEEAETQYLTLPPDTPRPQIEIQGAVQVIPAPPANLQPLVRHYSKPLGELVKLMNMYSNNMMADMLANAVGGPQIVAQKAAQAAEVSPQEIQLINGSGLGEENRISPRAACGMFLALERYLQPYNMTIADVVAIVGQDLGVLESRNIPKFSIIKTGSLDRVSTLAGVIPTQNQGNICMAIMNIGGELDGFRNQQDNLLQGLLTQWGSVASPPPEVSPTAWKNGKNSKSEIIKPSGT
ncbi:D-alanyl-D-alanine carboxypeptidase [Planktothricoides raciborskii]|uniref:D-alanyl-D-alanine carboxypeptidase n=1 Tax=Planktothricoides raciborskii FACHB-1370 TaxID=2949576 RepID=A0ABR8EAL4_9CYAN|nr:D-alanyl-D-alanine carboxypeptidase [Planktothricoides raciborskii]MBD2543223.1 D-alanyl-D-alanine carboxypeptidase [Planktothricoides raciborskii FACHB-1370]MBD2580861.1 D-alanyl-D-alanine carboxypeptidase [Planktothricoides raciborskii FACHB-1261]